jgi:uncharacterized protein (TIGR03083 family)
MTTATRVETIPAITRPAAEALARTEYARVADQLRALAPEDWSKPTDCASWDVRAVAGHSLGMMSDFTSFRAFVGRMRGAARAAKQTGAPVIDCMTAAQVADHAELSPAQLVARVDEIGPRAARWRAGAPAVFRMLPMKEEVGGTPETWRMGYLLDVVLTRDPWMHRVDVARATGRDLELTSGHDGRVVGDVVAEWARRHGRPFALTLTGPAGGEYVAGSGGDLITIDAVEFCRVLSGRAPAHGLLTQEVPF